VWSRARAGGRVISVAAGRRPRRPAAAALDPAQIRQAVGYLLGSPVSAGLPINNSTNSWFLIANASPYLYVADRPKDVALKLKSGQPLRGVGVFGRAGWAPQATNTITGDGSVALFARGLAESRQYDSAGVGWYINGISPDLQNQVRRYQAVDKQPAGSQGCDPGSATPVKTGGF